MTSTQRKVMESMGLSETEYVAHLEDALMRACQRLADSPQTYSEANSPDGWFIDLIDRSTTDKDTGESELLRKWSVWQSLSYAIDNGQFPTGNNN